MSTDNLSEINFSEPEVIARLARAYAVLIDRAKQRAKEAAYPPSEDAVVASEEAKSRKQEEQGYYQLPLF